MLSPLCPSLAFSGDLAHGEAKAKARSGVAQDEQLWAGGGGRADWTLWCPPLKWEC